PTRFHGTRGTHDPTPARRTTSVAYGALTLCGRPFQAARLLARLCSFRGDDTTARPPCGAFNPGAGIGPLTTKPAPVWAAPRSLAATGGILSVPRGTEMFQFPRWPSRASGMPGYDPWRIAPFGHPRLIGCSPLPAASRSVPRPSSADGA